ncbi:MAG: hypothetical protein Q7J01_04100, partial [Syntrophales bacterium]|nr:hypothetical protein [Syntrophales bacterium]
MAMDKKGLSQNLRTADGLVESPHATRFLIINIIKNGIVSFPVGGDTTLCQRNPLYRHIIVVVKRSRQVMFSFSSNEVFDISGLCCLLYSQTLLLNE